MSREPFDETQVFRCTFPPPPARPSRGTQPTRSERTIHPSPLEGHPLGLAPYPSAMTSLDLPSEHPLPADSQVDAEGAGMHSGEEEDYEQSAAAALLGMASALPMYRSLSQNSPGSFKRELDDPRQLLSDSRGSSSDDLSSIYSNGGGGVKRQRSETKDHGGAHTPFPAPRPARVSASCPRLPSSTTTEPPPGVANQLPGLATCFRREPEPQPRPNSNQAGRRRAHAGSSASIQHA